MGACADALRELRGIRERLTTGEGHGLEDEQASVVRLVQNSPCPALSALASHVQHERLEQVLLAWRTLVVEGLEPDEPRLPKVEAIQAQSPGGVARVISTSETTVNGVAVAIGAPGVPMNPWIDHARRVVDVLIARVEQAAKAEPSDPPTVSVSPELLDQLQRTAAAVDPGAIERTAERAAEKMAHALGGSGNAATKALPARTEVVLWEGAAYTDRNIRLARTRTAYLEAHGDVPAAIKALKDSGHAVARSTFYNHLGALDVADPGWRKSVQLSNPTGNLDGMQNVEPRGKSRDKVR